MTIAVTTPTGHVGARVVQLLVQAGVRPIVLVRDPDKLDPGIRRHVEIEQGDLADAAFVADATKGIDALLCAIPESFTADDPLGDMIRIGDNLAAAVRANGVSWSVLLSSVGAEVKRGAGLIDGLARAEEALAGTGANVLILRGGYYFTNLLGNIDAIKSGVLTTTQDVDVPMPWVDPRDIGEIAAARLLAADWSGVEVQAVHGPADLTWGEVAQVVSEATGSRVRVKVVNDDEMRATLSASGMGDRAVDGVIGMTAGLRDGFVPEQRRSPLSTTPGSLEAWVYTHLRPLLW
jgi:uncharacterized protein YbjT (DUF2867 family)